MACLPYMYQALSELRKNCDSWSPGNGSFHAHLPAHNSQSNPNWDISWNQSNLKLGSPDHSIHSFWDHKLIDARWLPRSKAELAECICISTLSYLYIYTTISVPYVYQYLAFIGSSHSFGCWFPFIIHLRLTIILFNENLRMIFCLGGTLLLAEASSVNYLRMEAFIM